MMLANLRARIHLPVLLLVVIALLGALWAALIRIGWQLPLTSIAGQHGAVMVSGFFGTLICLERAVALRRPVIYLIPLLSGLSALLLLLGLPPVIGQGGIVLAAFGLVLVSIYIYRIRSAIEIAALGLAAVMWFVGNLLWLLGHSIVYMVPWWAGFLIITIAAERLELSRVMMLTQRNRLLFKIALGLFSIGLLGSLINFDLGVRLSGVGLIALGAWLVRFDVARRTVRQKGLTRYIAACLLIGYGWLLIGGALWIVFGGTALAGFNHDALLHALFLGFVFSMIFGHAPIIIPAVVPVDFTYRSIFYVHLALLQLSLVVRVTADLIANQPLRMWAGLFNVIAILLFLSVMIRSAHRRPIKNAAAQPAV